MDQSAKLPFFHSSFLFFNGPTFLRRKKKEETYTAGNSAKAVFSFLASFKENSKGRKDCFTLGMLEKDLSQSDITLYWAKGGKGRNGKGVVNLKTQFPQGFCTVIQTSLFKSL